MRKTTQDKRDWQSHDIVYISSNSQKNGIFKVYVDDNEKMNFSLTNGYFAVENDEYEHTTDISNPFIRMTWVLWIVGNTILKSNSTPQL